MNLPLNKDKVLSCLDKMLSNNTGLKVVIAINDGLRVCNFLKGMDFPAFTTHLIGDSP